MSVDVNRLTTAELQVLSLAVRNELHSRRRVSWQDAAERVKSEMARYGFTEVDVAPPALESRGAVVVGRARRRGVSVRAMCEVDAAVPMWKLDVRLSEGEFLESTGASLNVTVRELARQASEMRANADAYSVVADELLHAAEEGMVKG